MLPEQRAHDALVESDGLEDDGLETPEEGRHGHEHDGLHAHREAVLDIELEGDDGRTDDDDRHGDQLARGKRLVEDEIREDEAEDRHELVEDDGDGRLLVLERGEVAPEHEDVQDADAGEREDVQRAHLEDRRVDDEQDGQHDNGQERGEDEQRAGASLLEVLIQQHLVDMVRERVQERRDEGEVEPGHMSDISFLRTMSSTSFG